MIIDIASFHSSLRSGSANSIDSLVGVVSGGVIPNGDGVGAGESITHPNQYTIKSREIERKGLEAATVKMEAKDGDTPMTVD